MHSTTAPIGTPAARPAAMIAMPPKATAAPAGWARRGRSPSTTASAIVKTACTGQAGGHALVHRDEQQPELPRPMNARRGRPTATGRCGRPTNRTAGKAISAKRSAANSSGGSREAHAVADEVDAPDDGDGRAARATWRRGGGSVVQNECDLWRRPVAALHGACSAALRELADRGPRGGGRRAAADTMAVSQQLAALHYWSPTVRLTPFRARAVTTATRCSPQLELLRADLDAHAVSQPSEVRVGGFATSLAGLRAAPRRPRSWPTAHPGLSVRIEEAE